ncbi:RING finger protein 37 [Cylas formicarius]|uniref:RING finger protein 37 n=1 Tax=Cylas formicarius TaxID=197179 RepID=UPI002958BA36|nr:RING finger protein 37 [Cylas formicarius]
MYDFLNSKLLPKVFCNKPSTENYEPENLITERNFNKGFIAFPSIKPPVALEFEFICGVNINYIILNTCVGSQRCSGVEIFAKNLNVPYTSICKAVYTEEGVIFCNSRRYSKECPPPQHSSDYHLSYFKSDTFNLFLNATGIKVVIFRTEKSVPCMASAQVWGIPSRSCSSTTKNTIERLMNKSALQNTTSDCGASETEEFKVPKDFRDDLTFELMTVPMTLPSGKTIDQSTLDKHLKIESSFARRACDPFTGQKFTGSLKPVLNVALKSRIDMFLLQNSHRPETFTLKRTLRTHNSVQSGTKKIKMGGHGDLDDILEKVQLDPNFHCFTSESTSKVCVQCGDSLQNMYLLPCKHCCCRTCLLDICDKLKCSLCGNEFVKSQVKKCNN